MTLLKMVEIGFGAGLAVSAFILGCLVGVAVLLYIVGVVKERSKR